MIDVSEVVCDPELAQSFQIERQSGQFVDGVWQFNTPTTIDAFGVVTPTSADDRVNFLPEGERQANAISVWCVTEIKMSDGNGSMSDEIVFNGQNYRVAYASPWQSYGYYKVIATGYPT